MAQRIDVAKLDCGTPGCRGERSYLIANLAAMPGADRTVGILARDAVQAGL